MEGGVVRKENCESTLHRPPPHPRYATVYPFPFTTSVLWLRETELAATAAATTSAAGPLPRFSNIYLSAFHLKLCALNICDILITRKQDW